MKFNNILYYVTEGKEGYPLYEQEGGVTGLGKRGRRPRSAGYSSNLQIASDVSDFEDKYGSAINKLFKKTPMYLLNFQDANGLPVEPSVTIAKTVENLVDEFSSNDYQVETAWFLDKKKSPVVDALKAAIEELGGKPVTNNTKLGHTARVVKNAILNATDVMRSVDAPEPAADEVSMMPGAEPADSDDGATVYSIVKSLKDVRGEFGKFLKSDERAGALIPVLRYDVFKGNELTKRELMTALIKTIKTKGIKDVNPLELFDFLRSVGVIVPASQTDDEEGREIDDEKEKVPVLDPDKSGVDRISSGDVERLTGGFGPSARGSGSMEDY